MPLVRFANLPRTEFLKKVLTMMRKGQPRSWVSPRLQPFAHKGPGLLQSLASGGQQYMPQIYKGAGADDIVKKIKTWAQSISQTVSRNPKVLPYILSSAGLIGGISVGLWQLKKRRDEHIKDILRVAEQPNGILNDLVAGLRMVFQDASINENTKISELADKLQAKPFMGIWDRDYGAAPLTLKNSALLSFIEGRLGSAYSIDTHGLFVNAITVRDLAGEILRRIHTGHRQIPQQLPVPDKAAADDKKLDDNKKKKRKLKKKKTKYDETSGSGVGAKAVQRMAFEGEYK
jgi:hypothetical protein